MNLVLALSRSYRRRNGRFHSRVAGHDVLGALRCIRERHRENVRGEDREPRIASVVPPRGHRISLRAEPALWLREVDADYQRYWPVFAIVSIDLPASVPCLPEIKVRM